LRGRGGGGYPTGRKWRLVRNASGAQKVVICNGDEGDPGAFMDRMVLESLPFRVIEGLAIAAYATGARQAIFYIRAEYPHAVQRVGAALLICRERGLLRHGDFELVPTVARGAGAFVCGEETALIASLEGERGMPRLRPPYPAEQGLSGLPTLVNNVETLAMVPWIVRHGPEAFAAFGTGRSKGTKVFALAGKVQRGGLVEVPMGTTIRTIVEELGGGVAPGRKLKAVQIGGPSGGCVPAELADTPVDYESLLAVGAMMGSGGFVVLDDTDCMVDVARYFLQFTQNQSCGRCAPCRIGTKRLLEILDRVRTGQGRASDLKLIEDLAPQIQATSLCGLGKSAPNPVLSTLRWFRAEYEAHLRGECPAGRCAALIVYTVTESCIGCTVCAQHCASEAIPVTPYERHTIDPVRCNRCGVCVTVCPVHAIEVRKA
ncbi:MAG: 4Fe-4S dicluster domain-containing protein, partial [Planctomycetes bacterium]|nr:4Fe-4S dicluster domain-containing protein [Planctomycetota bacterium]